MVEQYRKSPLTFEQQVQRLISRGLRVKSIDEARKILEVINYYRLSGYWHPLKKTDGSDQFRDDGSFELAIEFYEFDRKLRLLLMDMIERIEVTVRCQVSNHFAVNYGPFSHEDPGLFRDVEKHREWVERLHKETRESKEVFVQHFKNKYAEYPGLPVFVAAEVMSLGSMSWIFKWMKRVDRSTISRVHGLQPETFESWLRSLAFVRNLCAHHSRTWNRHISVAPAIPPSINGWEPSQIPNPQRIYAVLCVLRYLSRNYDCGSSWASKVAVLMAQFDRDSEWQNAMGIPPDWRDSVFWNGVT